MSDLGADRERVHSAAESAEPMWLRGDQRYVVTAPKQEMSMYTVEKPNQTSDNRCLAHAELDEVSGGQGNLANACIRAATQWLLDHAYLPDQVNHDCPPTPHL